jgi:hypothetical protein
LSFIKYTTSRRRYQEFFVVYEMKDKSQVPRPGSGETSSIPHQLRNRFSCLAPGLDWTRLFMSLTAGAGTRCMSLLRESPTLWLEEDVHRVQASGKTSRGHGLPFGRSLAQCCGPKDARDQETEGEKTMAPGHMKRTCRVQPGALYLFITLRSTSCFLPTLLPSEA